MVSIPTFLLYVSCALSVIAVLMSRSALARSSVVPDIPKRVAEKAAAAETAVKLLDARLDSHLKSDAGKASQAARKARGDGNGGDLAEVVATRDYSALENLILRR